MTEKHVWEQLENEFKGHEVIPIPKINSDEDGPVEPPAKKIRSLITDSDEGNELHKYISMTDKISRNKDPLLWWKYNEKKNPVVSEVTNKYLSVTATSVRCERWSSRYENKKSVITGQSQSTTFFEFIFKRKKIDQLRIT